MVASRRDTGATVLALFLAAVSVGARGQDGETPSPQQLLTRMVSAYETRTFSGRFLYMLAGEVSTLALERAVINGKEYEQLSHLQGPPTRIIRNSGHTVFVQPDDSITLLGTDSEISPLKLAGPASPGIADQYRARVAGTDRIAGRPCWRLYLHPRDRHRYGYHLWLDRESGLLLKSEVVNGERTLLERVEFISLNLNPGLDKQDFSLPKALDAASRDSAARPRAPRIRADWLPPGFALTARERHRLDGRTGVLHSSTYSDGLTAFTLFVEPVAATAAEPAPRRRGPTVVLARILQAAGKSFRATLVGEIPPATGRRVLKRITMDADGD